MKEYLGDRGTWASVEKKLLDTAARYHPDRGTVAPFEFPGLQEDPQAVLRRNRMKAQVRSMANQVINTARGLVLTGMKYMSDTGRRFAETVQYAVNGGIGASVSSAGANDHIVSLNDETEYMHPWKVTAWWTDDDSKDGASWYINVKPGFCNGIDPAIYSQKANGYNPFSVYKTQASALGAVGGGEGEITGIANLMVKPLGETNAADWIELTRGPVTKVQGFNNRDKLPEFFARLGGYNPNIDLTSGASSTAQLLATLGFQITNNGVTQDLTTGDKTSSARQVVGQDFWIEVPRAAYRTTVDIIANPLTGQLVDYNTVFDTSVFDQRKGQVRIYQGPFPQGREGLEGLLTDRVLSGTLDPTDPGVDLIRLFTFYLVQPPKDMRAANDNGKPNGSWAPYVQYHTTWNINHGVKNTPPININASAPIELTTAFFVGRFTLAAGALGAITAEFDRILNSAMNQLNGGKIWTT